MKISSKIPPGQQAWIEKLQAGERVRTSGTWWAYVLALFYFGVGADGLREALSLIPKAHAVAGDDYLTLWIRHPCTLMPLSRAVLFLGGAFVTIACLLNTALRTGREELFIWGITGRETVVPWDYVIAVRLKGGRGFGAYWTVNACFRQADGDLKWRNLDCSFYRAVEQAIAEEIVQKAGLEEVRPEPPEIGCRTWKKAGTDPPECNLRY